MCWQHIACILNVLLIVTMDSMHCVHSADGAAVHGWKTKRLCWWLVRRSSLNVPNVGGTCTASYGDTLRSVCVYYIILTRELTSSVISLTLLKRIPYRLRIVELWCVARHSRKRMMAAPLWSRAAATNPCTWRKELWGTPGCSTNTQNWPTAFVQQQSPALSHSLR